MGEVPGLCGHLERDNAKGMAKLHRGAVSREADDRVVVGENKLVGIPHRGSGAVVDVTGHRQGRGGDQGPQRSKRAEACHGG